MLRRFSRKPRGIEPAAPVGARDPEGAMRKLEEIDERASALGPSGLRADHLKNTLSTRVGRGRCLLGGLVPAAGQ
jgi:hypothetical protein